MMNMRLATPSAAGMGEAFCLRHLRALKPFVLLRQRELLRAAAQLPDQAMQVAYWLMIVKQSRWSEAGPQGPRRLFWAWHHQGYGNCAVRAEV
jgi:hypothetical protein